MIDPGSLERIYSSIGQYIDPITGQDLTLQAAIYVANELEKQGITSFSQIESRVIKGEPEKVELGPTEYLFVMPIIDEWGPVLFRNGPDGREYVNANQYEIGQTQGGDSGYTTVAARRQNFIPATPDVTKYYNKNTGQEITNRVLLDDKAGTKYTLTDQGLQKDFDPTQRLAVQLAQYVDPSSTGGAWSTESGRSSGPGYGPEGFLKKMAENFYNQTRLTDLNKLGYGKITTPENAPVVRQPIYGDYEYDYFTGTYAPTVTGYQWATPTADFETDQNGFLVAGGYRALSPQEITTIKDVGNGRYTADVVVGRKGYYNKDTGTPVKFNGTLGEYSAGPDYTRTKLSFTPEGKPRVTTQGESSSDLGTILPALAILTLPFTLGASSSLLGGEAALLAAESGIAAGGLGVAGAGYGAAASGLAGLGSSITSQLTSALPAELVQAGQTLASTFKTVRPYLQGANALYQASQGNIAGAISSGLGAAGGFGVPGAAEAAKVFNLAYGATQGNYLPVVQELLNQSGAGGALANTKIAGDFTVSDAFKGASFLQALQSGNPTVILNAAASLTGSQDLKVAAAANNFVNILNNPNATAFDIAMGADRIAGALNTASNQPPPNNAASHAQNLPRSNTAIGAVAVDDKGELYIMDDDGNRTSLTGVDAGRVYTPTEWNSIQAALSAGQAQYVNDLIGAMNNGTMKPEEVVQDLKSAGYSDDTISKIQQANQQFIDRANKAQQLAKDYSEVGSDIDRDNAIKQLEGLGFNPADATKYIDNIDRQVTARNDYANIARDFVANNLGTSEQAITKLRDSLANVGVTGDQQDEVVDAYNKMRLQAAGADLTPSEMTNLAVLAANKTNWVALPGKSGHEVAFALTDEGDPYVVAARDKDGNNLLNVYQNLTPQGVMQVVNAQLAQSRAAEQTKGAPNQYAVDKEISDAASAAGLVRTTGMIRNNFSTVNTDYFNNLLRQYSAMSPEDRAKIASASGVTTDLRVLKDIDAQYKAIDQQYAAAVANNSPAAKLYKSLDTRVENKAGYYYTNNGVQPSTAMAMAVQDLQGGNLFNRVNLTEVQDSKFPFETKEFINQFRGTPAGDKLSNLLANAYAIGTKGVTESLNGTLGINLHIAEAFGLDNFAEDFRKMSLGLRQAGDDAGTIAGADTREHQNFIGGVSNLVTSIPWLMAGPAGIPGLLASAGSTTYGNEYLNARLKGESIENSSERATYMALIEMVTERFGLGDLTKLLKPALQNVPINQMAKVASESLVPQLARYMTKEQIGELTAFSLQFATDKYADVGLNKQSTGLDFLQGAADTIQQTFWAAGAAAGIPIGLRGNMTPDNSGAIKVISPDGSQGLVELGNGSVIRVDIPEGLDLKVGEDININALMHDAVYVPDNVNERFNTLESQIKDIYQTELGRPPTFAELDFNVRRLADGTDILAVANELNNSQAGQLLDQRNTFNAQTDQQIAANAKSLLDQGRTTYAEFKDFMNTMGLASDRQLNVLDTITPRANVAGTVTSIIGDNAVVTGTDGQMYTMLRVAPNNYLIQVGDQVNLGVSTVKPDATPTVEVTTKIADVIAASVSKSTSISLSQSVSEAAVSTSISKSQSLSVSYSQSQSLSASTSVSVSESQSKSISLSQSVSTVELEKSISLSKSVSTSLSTSASLSTSTSLSQSVSASTSTSQSLSASISKAVSISEALSLSASVSEQMEKDRLKGLSISASLSESISQAVSVSESISKAVSISESTSASISTSQSISQATSISQSLSASTSQSESVSKATSISASVSASTSASLSASTSQSISLSQEVSKQVSISQSTSQSISLSQSLSQSQAVSISTSVSESVVKSASASLSLSQSTSAALSTSVSQSLSLSQKMSEDIVAGLSISASLSASQSVSQSISALISESISKAQSVTQTQSPAATQTVTQSITQSVTQSITQAITQSLTESLTLSITESITQPITLAPTIMPSVTLAPSISVTETFTQTPSLTMVITTTSLPPVTTTITIPPVTTTEPVTTEQVTTVTIPPVTPPPTSGTIPPVTTPSISVPDQTTTAPITTLPVTTAPITTAVTTARPPTTTARPLTTTARPGGLPFPIFGIPAATGQQTTYIDYAQPKVPAPEFGPYDLFKAPSYLRPLQDSGNFGLAALIGAASESQQRNGNNQSQQNAESQGQAPTG